MFINWKRTRFYEYQKKITIHPYALNEIANHCDVLMFFFKLIMFPQRAIDRTLTLRINWKRLNSHSPNRLVATQSIECIFFINSIWINTWMIFCAICVSYMWHARQWAAIHRDLPMRWWLMIGIHIFTLVAQSTNSRSMPQGRRCQIDAKCIHFEIYSVNILVGWTYC